MRDDLSVDRARVRRALPAAARRGLPRAGDLRHHRRGELAVGRRADRGVGGAGRRRHPRRRRCCPAPARARCRTRSRLTQAALALGAPGVLALPPFYYKGVSDDGLFRFFAELIERVGDDRLRLFLYHIPPMAQVGFTPELIGRLLDAYPGTIAGTKDRAGDAARIERICTRVPAADGVRGHRDVPARHAALGRRRLHLGDGQRHRAPGARGLRPVRRRRGRRAPRRPR